MDTTENHTTVTAWVGKIMPQKQELITGTNVHAKCVFRMYGLFQTTFYFGYMALFSLALGIMCGQWFVLLVLWYFGNKCVCLYCCLLHVLWVMSWVISYDDCVCWLSDWPGVVLTLTVKEYQYGTSLQFSSCWAIERLILNHTLTCIINDRRPYGLEIYLQ